MIIDAFPFFNEIPLLQVRLNYLGPVVDRFAIIESTIDFAGKNKEILLTEDLIQRLPYAEKIRVIHWKPSSFLIRTLFKLSSATKYRRGLWQIQHLQRNHLLTLLSEYNPEDFLIFGDLDEIPDAQFLNDRDHLNALLKEHSIYSFDQTMYYYNIFCIKESSWRGTVLSKVRTAIAQTPKIIRKYRLDYPLCAKGWHFSYFGDAKKIKQKINAIADVERLSAFKAISEADIARRVNKTMDLYDRPDAAMVSTEHPEIPSSLVAWIHQYLPNCAQRGDFENRN